MASKERPTVRTKAKFVFGKAGGGPAISKRSGTYSDVAVQKTAKVPERMKEKRTIVFSEDNVGAVGKKNFNAVANSAMKAAKTGKKQPRISRKQVKLFALNP